MVSNSCLFKCRGTIKADTHPHISTQDNSKTSFQKAEQDVSRFFNYRLAPDLFLTAAEQHFVDLVLFFICDSSTVILGLWHHPIKTFGNPDDVTLLALYQSNMF